MARDFNGTTGTINIPDNAALDLTNNCTVAFWVWFDSVTGSAYSSLVSKRNPAPTQTDWSNFGFNYVGSGGDNVLQMFYNTSGTFRVVSAALSTNFNAAQWYHVVGVWAQNGIQTDQTLYRDGASLAGPTTLNENVAPNAAALVIGSLNGAAEFHDGRIAEVAVWSVALTANEVAMIRRVGPNRVRRGSLVGLWRLGVGSPEPDWSGNVNQGTISGTTAVIDHPPSAPPFGFDLGWQGAFTAVAGGSTQPPRSMHQFRQRAA